MEELTRLDGFLKLRKLLAVASSIAADNFASYNVTCLREAAEGEPQQEVNPWRRIEFQHYTMGGP